MRTLFILLALIPIVAIGQTSIEKGQGYCIAEDGKKYTGKVIYKLSKHTITDEWTKGYVQIKSGKIENKFDYEEVDHFVIDGNKYVKIGYDSSNENQVEPRILEEVIIGDKISLYYTHHRDYGGVSRSKVLVKNGEVHYVYNQNSEVIVGLFKDNKAVYDKYFSKKKAVKYVEFMGKKFYELVNDYNK